MTDIVDRLRKASVYEEYKAILSNLGDEAADEIEGLRKALEVHAGYAAEVERLREALQGITDHLASVMGGPLIAGRGITFANGVEGVPIIAKAREALATLETVIRDEIRTTLEAREQAREVKR